MHGATFTAFGRPKYKNTKHISKEIGIAPGTKFEDLPDDFECPLCGVGKDMFSEQ